ncbi:MAG: hypothetical protein QXX33_00915 [Candidatus Hadarchaeales archaeon]
MREKSKINDNLRSIVNSLVSLCPAYNPVSYWLRSLKNISIADAITYHSELLKYGPLRVLIELFGIELRDTVDYKRDCLGETFLKLVDTIEETFENEKVRKTLEEALEIRLEKTPAQEYVEMCMETLSNDKVAIRILQEIARSGPIGVDDLQIYLDKRYSMKCTREEILEKLRKIRIFSLLSVSENSKIDIIKRYKKYIISTGSFQGI